MYASDSYNSRLLSLQAQDKLINQWLLDRLNHLLPQIMQREGFDMWLVIAREYNEDPVIMTMLPRPAMAARRRTILVFCLNPDGTCDRLTVSRYGQEGFYQSVWNPDEDDQFTCLHKIIQERNPTSIGINYSHEFAFGDGLSYGEYQKLASIVDEIYLARTHSAERLCVGWLETRIESELIAYPGIVEIGHSIIAEAFSTRVIHPGITTTHDVVWWMRQRMQEMGLRAWFHPSVEIQAHGHSYVNFYSNATQRTLILPGDLLWCDMGFYYLGLATDQQQHAYVLRPGENDAPPGLKAALSDGNRLQDIHMSAMQVGRIGNEVLRATLQQARDEGIQAAVYSHPLGYHGHAAGPVIGLWDQQENVQERGDYEIFDNTCYSIELNVKKAVPEWDNQEVRIALEENAALHNGQMRWLHGRQTHFHII